MGIKFNIEVSKEELTEALSSRRYSGPTPPNGLYRVKLRKLWSGEDKMGDVFKASIQISEPEGSDNAVYNGYDFLESIRIPTDSSNQYFSIQVSILDNFLKSISGGGYDITQFIADAGAGKIIPDGDADKVGTPIKSIGKLKIDECKKNEFKAMTKNREYNDKTYTGVHYFDMSDIKVSKPSEDTSDPWSGDDEDDDLDSLLGGI